VLDVLHDKFGTLYDVTVLQLSKMDDMDAMQGDSNRLDERAYVVWSTSTTCDV
jgi:hypothetical protein